MADAPRWVCLRTTVDRRRWGAALVGLVVGAVSVGSAVAGPVSFERDVAPILTKHCIRCHRPENKKGDLSLANASDLEEGGAVEPGNPAESTLLEAIATPVRGGRPAMPKEGTPLSLEQVETLRRWVAEGASWPKEVVLKEPPKAGAEWWALRPLVKVEPPKPKGLPEAWSSNPIDGFVFQGLTTKGLRPSPPAEKPALIRRLTFDLTGLPPTPEEIQAFEADGSPVAYERLVERLLASPRYGERWGRHWLDVIRFGESRGFERNEIINNAWPFRDYVIDSFNDDKPFNALVREHLAGDVIGKDRPEIEVGTTFLVCGPYDDVGNQDAAQAALIRANTLDDVIRATSESFLGLTVGCARCHDHKFDPITSRDYYALYATFAGVRHGGRTIATAADRARHAEALRLLHEKESKLVADQSSLEAKAKTGVKPTPEESNRLRAQAAELTTVRAGIAAVPALPNWWAGTFESAPGPFRVFKGGDPQRKGEEVAPSSLGVLSAALTGYSLPPTAPESERRRALADWLVDARNPLTPRVLANRLWHYHFGTGIVDTPSDFGVMGGRPTHPELLDWLARGLIEGGWKLKPLHRLIVSSQTYRQSSRDRAAASRIDGASRFLWRFPPRRLSAEEVRDTILSAAGMLDSSMGGPGFKLYSYLQDNVSTYVPIDRPGPETYRRAVYHHSARASYLDLLTDFDCPDTAFGAPRRASTTSPLQALTLLNHGFALDAARGLADRLRRDAGGDPVAQVRRAFALAFGRAPTAGESAFCRAVLNTNELIYVD